MPIGTHTNIISLLETEKVLRSKVAQSLQELLRIREQIARVVAAEDRKYDREKDYRDVRIAHIRFQNLLSGSTRQIGALLAGIENLYMPPYISPEKLLNDRRKEIAQKMARKQRMSVRAHRDPEVANATRE